MKREVVMRFLMILLSLAAISASVPLAQADTRMDIGATIVNGDMRGFYFALGDYYRVPEREVILMRERRIPDYDIPVVLFISQRARVAPGVIMDLRLSGRSWMDITLHFGLGPDIYYIPVKEVYGPPYGRAYGHYKNKHRKDWRKIRLIDSEVVDMVNLRFMSEHYGRPPEEVMRMRSGGKSFTMINDEFRRDKPGKEYREREQYQEQRSRDGATPDERSQRGKKDPSPGQESKGQGRDNNDARSGKGKGRDKDD
jgi:hypothetical protein